MAPLLHWLVLFVFWLVLSGVFDAKHMGIGVVATAAVAYSARRLESVGSGGGEEKHMGTVRWDGVFTYAFWLLKAIVDANLEVARIVLDPRLPIEPAMVRVPTRVTSDVEITLLANSITATPGTITVHAADEENREFVIHTLMNPDAVPAAVRDMEDRVLRALHSPRA